MSASSSASNAELIDRFYRAFQARDAEAMNACYAPDIKFSDPVFGPLEGDRVRAMWRMLNRPGGSGLELAFQVGEVDESTGTATWQARYRAPNTGRPVENHITTRVWFADGLIARQEDTFDLWLWASQALGTMGRLLGWTPMLKATIRKQALASLDKYIHESGG
jgi:ketosteroid isomerase-like protein